MKEMKAREIKFRGMDANGVMRYGRLSQDKPYSTNYYDEYSQRICWDDSNIPVRNDTLGQYTGLKDKDGKEVYEGDILGNFKIKTDSKGNPYMPYPDMPEYIEIYWFNSEYAYWGRETKKTQEDYDYDLTWTNYYDFEVVGNIYKNPELLDSASIT